LCNESHQYVDQDVQIHENVFALLSQNHQSRKNVGCQVIITATQNGRKAVSFVL
jgi:hypothetical protein